MKQVLATLILVISSLAAATEVRMLEIQTETDGDKIVTVDLKVAPDSTFQNFIYNNPTKPIQTFTIAQLNEERQSLVKKLGVDILEVSGESLSKNNLNVNIHYLYNHKLIGKSDRRTKKLRMYYVSPTGLYETQDLDTKKIVTKAFVWVRWVDGKEKGIDRIETW